MALAARLLVAPSTRRARVMRSIGSLLKTTVDGLGAVVFPSVCVVCGGHLAQPLAGPLCPTCLEGWPAIAPPFCPRCGLPYPEGVAEGLCGPCRLRPRYYRRARALAPFVHDVRLCLHALKFGGRRRLAGVLGRRAGERLVASGVLEGASALVPVPLSRRRRRERGFNQAELIAHGVSRASGVPLSSRVLWKMGERPPQSGLSAGARRRNAAGVYRAKLPQALRGRDLLLVDDVLTTGATAEAASRALLRAGASAVDVLVLARVL